MKKRRSTPTRVSTTLDHVSLVAKKLSSDDRFNLVMLALVLHRNSDLRDEVVELARQVEDRILASPPQATKRRRKSSR